MLRECLKSLPETLEDTYTRILLGIPKLLTDDDVKLLEWLACGARPLRIEELVDAIAVNLEDNPRFVIEDRYLQPREVLSAVLVPFP